MSLADPLSARALGHPDMGSGRILQRHRFARRADKRPPGSMNFSCLGDFVWPPEDKLCMSGNSANQRIGELGRHLRGVFSCVLLPGTEIEEIRRGCFATLVDA